MAKFRAPPSAPQRKLVWRISPRAPKGEWVDPSVVEEPPPGSMQQLPEVREVSSGGWVMSSFDLLHGTDVNEDDNTIPGELLDELFPPPSAAPKAASKK